MMLFLVVVERRAFEDELKRGTTADPLDVWRRWVVLEHWTPPWWALFPPNEWYELLDACHSLRRYIAWTEEHFPANGSDSHLLDLRERCTRELVEDARYKNDPRYVRIWIQYVREEMSGRG